MLMMFAAKKRALNTLWRPFILLFFPGIRAMKSKVHNLFILPICLSLCFSCGPEPAPSKKNQSDKIRLNQIGYYPNAVKKAVITGKTTSDTFQLLHMGTKAIPYEGTLSESVHWPLAGEEVRVADFSAFNKSGEYVLQIDGLASSYPFIIDKGVLREALLGSVKALYYQRMGVPLEEQYAGQWQRKAGHPDQQTWYHSSSGKTNGSKASPGGWYDAGDYNKYVVNGAFSLGQLFALYEQYPEQIQDGDLNIPESGNERSDLLDELKYEMDWVLTMQDEDGGVFHKVTTKNFEPMVMPDLATSKRYIVGKGTAATLDFAAAAAQASRVFAQEDAQYANQCLSAAERAWQWAQQHPEVVFRNPEDIRTGEYGDDDFSDELYWAAAELYTTTQKQVYLEYLNNNPPDFTFNVGESWNGYMRFLGMYSLLSKAALSKEMKDTLLQGLQKTANGIVETIKSNNYFQPIQKFKWGSNSDILNAAMLLAQVHRHLPSDMYLKAVEESVDYIFGKNAVGYSFLTGFGDRSPMFIHHRQSEADGIDQPVPGLLSGGPNLDRQDIDQVNSYPDNEFPMQSWADHVESYASNEICLNWNAPLTYVLGFLEMEGK